VAVVLHPNNHFLMLSPIRWGYSASANGPHKDDLSMFGPHKDDLSMFGPRKDDLFRQKSGQG